MSYQHTDRPGQSSDNEQNEKEEQFGLERFVRNRYFSGKLMTARDMQAEQEYHANRLETIDQHVLGEGVVCGLDTSITSTDDGITVSLDPGVAIDAHGRIIIVDGATDVPFTGSDAPDGDFSLFLELEQCDSEKVPKKGAKDACEDSCEFNRVVEDYDLVLESDPPVSEKPIPDLEFPTYEEKAKMVDGATEPAPSIAKSKPARSFNSSTENGTFRYNRCGTGGDPAVFLGYYQIEGGSYYLDKETHPRHYVYTNDLLYATILSHATDLDNPHNVVTTINDIDHTGGDSRGNIQLVSDDGSIGFTPSEDRASALSLQLATEIQNEIGSLAEYVRDKTLKYTIEAFYDVAATYADIDGERATTINNRAVDIIELARDALDEAAFADQREFADAVREIGSHELEIRDLLAESRNTDAAKDLATSESFEDYTDAVDDLVDILPTEDDGAVSGSVPNEYVVETNVTALAVSQDQLCETATWLERASSETVAIPGGHELDARIIQDIIDTSVVETDGLQPGDYVVDSDDTDQQPAVVIKVTEETADEWNVYGDESVAYQNEDYDADERVILVTYEHLLDENWEYWKAADSDDLFYGVVTRSIKFHAFPESRLERMQE